MTQAWMVIHNEYGFLVYNEKTKIFFDKTQAMNYMYELFNDPETRKNMMPNDPENMAYKTVEVNIE